MTSAATAMAIGEWAKEDTELVLDAFPLPPAHSIRSAIKPPASAVPQSPPESPPEVVERYQTRALPPLPLKSKIPSWGERSNSLIPAPLSIKSPTRSQRPSPRPSTPQPTPSSPQAFDVQRPRTAVEDVRISVIEKEIIKMAWSVPTTSLGARTWSNATSLTDTSREASIDSRPDSLQHPLPIIDEPVSPTHKRHNHPPPIQTSRATSEARPVPSSQARKSSRKLLSLTGANPVFTNTPGFLSPTGHNPAAKIKKLFGIYTSDMNGSVPISPVASVGRLPWGGSVSAPVSEPDSDQTYSKNLPDTRSVNEAWMRPSPTLPPLEVGDSLAFSPLDFMLAEPAAARTPSTLQVDQSHAVRDLYHFSVLKISEEKAKKDGTKTTVVEVGKTRQKNGNKNMPKSPAQYSFFPRTESFSTRRRNSAALGNGKLPPTPLVPKPKFVHGKHPMKTPFPGGNGNLPLPPPHSPGAPSARPVTAGLSTAGLSTAGLVPGRYYYPPDPAPLADEDDFADVRGVDEIIYRSQPVSAFDLDDEQQQKNHSSFLSEKRISALSSVFRRRSGAARSSREDRRRRRSSKDSFASNIGSHVFSHKPPPRHIVPATPPGAVITTTVETPERAMSFTSTESAGWFARGDGGASGRNSTSSSATASTTPASASAIRFTNPFSRSHTALAGDRPEAELGEEEAGSGNAATTGEKMKSLRMKLATSPLRLPRPSSANKRYSSGPSPSLAPAGPGRVGGGKSASRRDRSAERRRNGVQNKIRIIPEGEVAEGGEEPPAESKKRSRKKRLSVHGWRS